MDFANASQQPEGIVRADRDNEREMHQEEREECFPAGRAHRFLA